MSHNRTARSHSPKHLLFFKPLLFPRHPILLHGLADFAEVKADVPAAAAVAGDDALPAPAQDGLPVDAELRGELAGGEGWARWR